MRAKTSRKISWRWLLLAAAGLLIAALLVHRPVLTWAGEYMVVDDHAANADLAIVLSGEEGDGLRTRGAVDLYKAGVVKKVMLSGARGSFARHETAYSEPLALSLGMPKEDLVLVNHRGRSTFEEAKVLRPALERLGAKSVIVVTSNFHTRRAKRYFERAFEGKIRVYLYPVESDWFSPNTWWQSREGLKYFYFEATKLASSYVD